MPCIFLSIYSTVNSNFYISIWMKCKMISEGLLYLGYITTAYNGVIIVDL
jgi:hypothetical protein